VDIPFGVGSLEPIASIQNEVAILVLVDIPFGAILEENNIIKECLRRNPCSSGYSFRRLRGRL